MKNIMTVLIFISAVLSAQSVPLEPVSATHGAKFRKTGGALIIDFPAYSLTQKNTHPTVNLHLPKECSLYDGVEVDLQLSDGVTSSLSINFRDSKGKQCYDVRPIADRLRTTLRFYFNPMRKMDKKNMKFLRIYQSRPALSSQFTIYSIKLFSLTRERKDALRTAAAQFGLLQDLEKITSVQACEIFAERLRKKQLEQFIRSSSGRIKVPDIGAGFLHSLDRPRPFNGVLKNLPVHHGQISAAANETENLHIVTVSSKKINKLSAHLSGLPAAISASVRPVGAVKTVASRARGARLGWYFDPILEYTSQVTALAPYQIQLWVIRIKPQRPGAGSFSGTVHFNADGRKFLLPLKVKVHNFSLPQRKTLRTATSVYGSKVLGKHKKEFEKWLLANFFLNNFSIYSESGGYDIPKLPPISEYKDALKRGLNFIPLLYLKLPRQAHHTGKRISPQTSKMLWEKMTHQEQAHYPAEWKKRYVEILKKRIPELKKAGLWQYAVCYAFDEATPSERPAIIDLVRELKKHFPDLKIASTISDNTYGLQNDLGGIIDEWIPPLYAYNFAKAEKARKLNRKVWYYTTGMTVDGTHLSEIRTQLGERAIASKIDGWLVWTVSRWYGNPRPISGDVPLTKWDPQSYPGDNGGGSYFCMGENGTFLSTLRAEAMRDGIEDHEYYTLMMKLANRRKISDPLRRQAENFYKTLSRSGKISADQLLKNRQKAALLIERMKNK